MKRATRPPMPEKDVHKVKPRSKWKVYGWSGYRDYADDKGIVSLHGSREIMCAPTKAAVVRALDSHLRASDVVETANELELKVAKGNVGRVHHARDDYRKYRQHKPGNVVPAKLSDWSKDPPPKGPSVDEPFTKKVAPVEVTIWAVDSGWTADEGRPTLHSLKCLKYETQYRLIKTKAMSHGPLAFGCGAVFEHADYEEDATEAIARFIRDQERAIEGHRKDIEARDADIANATLLYLREPG